MIEKVVKGLLIGSVTTATSLWACNGSHVLGASGSGAVYTMSADTMKEGSFYLGFNVELLNNKSLSDKAITNAIENGSKHIHSIDSINTYALALSYGITDTLTLNMNLPYSSKRNIRAGEHHLHDDGHGHVHDEGEVHTHGNSEGIGDLSALLQYKIYDQDKTKFSLLAGIKAPTGKSNVADGDEVLESDLQPGSDSWDYFAGAALSKDFEDFSLLSSVLYKYNTEGMQHTTLGDVFTYNAAISYKLLGDEHDHGDEKWTNEAEGHDHFEYELSWFVELNGEYAKSDSHAGLDIQNTGHHVIFANTGLQMSSSSDYSAFIALGTPIYEDYTGVQNTIDYKFSFGIGKSF